MSGAGDPGRNEHLLRRMQAQRDRRVRRRWIGIGLVAALLTYVVVFGPTGWLAVQDARQEVEDLEARIAAEEMAAAEAEAALEALEEAGGHALERLARERYRMQRPDEEVFHLIGGEAAADGDESP